MLAWMHAVPQPPPGSARAKAGVANKLSRADRLKREGAKPEMPPNPLPHFIGWFAELGMVQSGGMGPAPLSWGEIGEWQRSMNIMLEPWEAALMRHLSVSYITEKARAEEEGCPAPWRGKVTQSEQNAELKALIAVLG